jgi:hypothetical protein
MGSPLANPILFCGRGNVIRRRLEQSLATPGSWFAVSAKNRLRHAFRTKLLVDFPVLYTDHRPEEYTLFASSDRSKPDHRIRYSRNECSWQSDLLARQ